MNVSVVIPTYNRGSVVCEAIESVLAQSHRAFEVIIVDDGSTDNTRSRLDGYITKKQIRFFSRANSGPAAARNDGARLASGQLLAFLDSDDLWKPRKLENDVRFLETHNEVEAVFTDLEKHDGDRFVPSFMRDTGAFSEFLRGHAFPQGVTFSQRTMYLCLLREAVVKTPGLTIRREAFVRAGGFNPAWRASSDWEFLIRFSHAYRFGYIDQPLAVIRVSRDSVHRVDAIAGWTSMIDLLASKTQEAPEDAEAVAAAHWGIATLTKHVAWHHLERQERWRAFKAYLSGFRTTGERGLALRALGSLLPPWARQRARRIYAKTSR